MGRRKEWEWAKATGLKDFLQDAHWRSVALMGHLGRIVHLCSRQYTGKDDKEKDEERPDLPNHFLSLGTQPKMHRRRAAVVWNGRCA